MAVSKYSAGPFPVFGPNPTGNLPLFAYIPGGWAERWPQTFPPAVPPDEQQAPFGPPAGIPTAGLSGGYGGFSGYGNPLFAFVTSVGSKIGTAAPTVLEAIKNMDPETASKWVDTVGKGYLTVQEIRANVRSATSPAAKRRGRRRRRRPARQADPRVDAIQAQIAQLTQAMQAQQAAPRTPSWILPAAIGGGALLLVVALMAGRRRPAPRRSYAAPRS